MVVQGVFSIFVHLNDALYMEERSTSHTSARSSTVVCRSQKHGIVYVGPVLGLLILPAFYYFIPIIWTWVPILLAATSLTMHILNLRSTSWELTEEGLTIRSGFFSWQQFHYEIHLSMIYEAYYEHGLIPNLLGYGHLNLRRTDGSTSSFRTTCMTLPDEMTGSINRLVNLRNEALAARHQGATSAGGGGLADELHKLSIVYEKGLLTREEFEQLKQRILNGETTNES